MLKYRKFFTNESMHPQIFHYCHSLYVMNTYMTLNYAKIQFYVRALAYQSQTHTVTYLLLLTLV